MTYPFLEDKLEPYIKGLFEKYPHRHLIFHTPQHTRDVVAHAKEIATQERFGEEDLLILAIAAWFHDTGHLVNGIENHEQRSVEYMKQFLKENGVEDEEFAGKIEGCIMATRLPHHPEGPLQEIICDADVYHLGTKAFRKTNKLVKEELKLRNYKQATTDWLRRSLKLMEEQHFFTSYCQQLLHKGKLENVQWLKKKIAKKDKEEGKHKEEEPAVIHAGLAAEEVTPKQQAKQDQSLVARGVQTFLRLASSNHLTLSRMADGKANILISVNSIIISVILSVFVDRLDTATYLTIPTILFLTSSVITIVLAILATRPKLTEGSFLKEDIINRKTNLLFFGNFYKSSLEDYQWAMGRLLTDKEYIYGTLVKDVYFLGKVLGRKYKLIRLAYNIFMLGIVLSVIAFGVAVALKTPQGQTTIIDGGRSPF